MVAGLTLARNLGASDNHIGLNESEHTPWLSFVADSPGAALALRADDAIPPIPVPCLP